MNGINQLYLIDFCDDIKSVFGSFAILDDIETENIPEVAQFAKIVNNYLKMKRVLNDGNFKQEDAISS